jgi:hypothetical protein
MKTRDVVIGFIFLVVLIAGILWIFRTRGSKTSNLPLPTPNISERIKNAFPNLNIPDGVERANLSDVTGGDSIGVATRTEVVANLPELTSGKFYQVMLEDSSGKSVKLGNMRIAKSGYILEYNSANFPGFNKVIVVQGSTRILEGSF